MTVRKWLDVNKLSLNFDKDKTKFMVFDNLKLIHRLY